MVSSVHLQGAYEAFDSNVDILHRELENGMPISAYLEKYRELLELRVVDIERIKAMDSHIN